MGRFETALRRRGLVAIAEIKRRLPDGELHALVNNAAIRRYP